MRQIEDFQIDSHHRCLITGRPLALQGLERSAFRSDCLERVELIKMNNNHQDAWLQKWQAKFKYPERQKFEKFLKACPLDIYDRSKPRANDQNLVGEPLMLYLLARMHRDGAIQATELTNTVGLQAKIKIYDRAVDWVLNRQRDKLNQQAIGSAEPELRQLLGEVAVCVMQSGNEMTKVRTIELRLPKDPQHTIRKIYDRMSTTQQDEKERTMNTFLTAFYLQPAAGDTEGSVEFTHKSFGEFLFAERLKEAITDWSSVFTNRRGQQEDEIKQEDLEWQIYDLLGYGCLTTEIVSYLWTMLENSDDWQPIRLFDRLNGWWESWCDGEFIDASPENLPQKKMRLLREQMPDRTEILGLRQVDIYTGLNILILLLNLNYYAQTRDDLKNKIVFYPSGRSQRDKYTDHLLKVIHYGESIGLTTFNQDIVFHFSGANLSNANLRGADLSDADLSGANLSNANLSDANLSNADLRGADLSGANLSDANLSIAEVNDADLRGAYLNNANLSNANLSNANLRDADLRVATLRSTILEQIKWDLLTNWQNVQGVETIIDMPKDLNQHLKDLGLL